MPDQQEELRLTVTLVDNASAGLEKLKDQLKEIGGEGPGGGGKHLSKMGEQTKAVGEAVKKMGLGFDEAFKSMGMMRLGIAGGAAGLALFGVEIARQIKNVSELTDQLRAIGQAAKNIGVDPAQFKGIIEQFKAVGVSSETATQSIEAITAKLAELQRTGSKLRVDMMRAAGHDPEAQKNMEAYLDSLKNAKTLADELNIIKKGGEDVYRHALEQTHSTVEAANRRNEFWALQGYNAQLQALDQAKNLSKEEQALADQRIANAAAYSNKLGEVSGKWDTLIEHMKSPLFGPDSPLLWTLNRASELLDLINGKLEQGQKQQADVDKRAPEPEGWQRFNPFNPANKAREQLLQEERRKANPETFGAPRGNEDEILRKYREDMKARESTEDNTKATKDLTDQLAKANQNYVPMSYTGGGAGRSPLLQNASFTTGGPAAGGGGSYSDGFPGGGGAAGGGIPRFGGGGYTNLEAGGGGGGGGGGGAPYGSKTGGPAGGAAPGPVGDPSVPSDILSKAQAVALHSGPGGVEKFMRDQGYPKAGNWCGEFAASVVKGAGGTPPKNPAIASNWRNWGTEVDSPQPGDIAVRRGARTGSTGSHVTVVENVGKGTFTGLGGNQGRWESTQQTGRYQFYRSGQQDTANNGSAAGGQKVASISGDDKVGAAAVPSGAANPAAGDVGGGGAEYLRQSRAGLTKQLEDNPHLKKELAALGTLEHESDATAVVESLYNRTNALNEKRAKEGKPPLSLEHMMKGGFYGPAKLIPGRLAELERNPARMKAMLGKIDAAATSNLLKGATDQGSGNDPNVYWPGGKTVRDGETYNDWGGGAGHEGNRRWREKQQAEIAAADRRQVDKSESQVAKVEGSGKISVDVNAPKGTSVGAEGKGLFKDVEINRQTQMAPARRGPAAPEESMSI